MAALKKDILHEFDNLIKSLSEEEQQIYVDRVMCIKEKFGQFLSQEEDDLYDGIVYESLKEAWDNEKDDAYNDL
ncbi:hypothetical protein [Oceanobacillus alkalisoli]|uniref:hypothetical protein n=1 Tax=Oceanobacillus alkalisoli TaxID=2925113 RepID=UPI001F11C37A|nr:hypothetical protein [Oceanobacillus alkalisoli]MCF3942580.1 hypothetical protein [Oceanobacillus alkalisoli]